MIHFTDAPVVGDREGRFIKASEYAGDWRALRDNSMAWQIMKAHNFSGDSGDLRLKMDVLAAPDDNYASTLQEFRAFGRDSFALPWVFTNCHNSMGCTGGTVSNDDHRFGLDCAKKYGGIYVPPYCAVLHQYMRESVVCGGQMVLASDSHTRYGCLGAMGVGEGGTEVARQAAGDYYSIKRPKTIAVKLTGALRPGIGPMDAALTLIGAAFPRGFFKNRILEFMGDGIHPLSMDARFQLDAMTTEAGAFSTIWLTDERVREYFISHQRPEAYREMRPLDEASYDGLVELDLSGVEAVIALPFHPGNVFSIHELNRNQSFAEDVFASVERDAMKRSGGLTFTLLDKRRNGRLSVQSAAVGGCIGGLFENLKAVAEILDGSVIPAEGVPLGLYPASQAVYMELERQGLIGRLLRTGAVLHPSICGPCFGTLDIPANNSLSIRTVSRNFYGREGSRPDQGQLSAAALMDARSIAATVRNGGLLTAADEIGYGGEVSTYCFDASFYRSCVYNGYDSPDPAAEIRLGPNIKDWPAFSAVGRHLLVRVAGTYGGSTTTDELCPSGEASALRSNPERLAGYTLISKDPDFAARARRYSAETRKDVPEEVLKSCIDRYGFLGDGLDEVQTGSLVIAEEIGDGSSREQAASNQRVLGVLANLAGDYSTKRYRSNCINWGIIPLQTGSLSDGDKAAVNRLRPGDYLFLPDIRRAILEGSNQVELYIPGEDRSVTAALGEMSREEREILASGGLINFFRK